MTTHVANTVVLGAGPVGLIAARILSADLVIGMVPGGDGTLRELSPSYLWATAATRGFLRDLGLEVRKRVARFGWILPGEVYSDRASREARRYYYERSRGGPVGRIPSSVASSGRSGGIETFDVDVGDVVRELLRPVYVHVERVERVEISSRGATVRTSVGTYRAKRIVNTLPAPLFRRLSGYPEEAPLFRAGYKTFVVGGPYSLLLEEAWRALALDPEGGREFFYVADPEIPFDRVKILPGSPTAFSYEFNGREEPGGFLRDVGGRVALSAPLQIEPGSKEAPRFEARGTVYNVGRLARWKHSIRLHDVVEELYRVAANG